MSDKIILERGLNSNVSNNAHTGFMKKGSRAFLMSTAACVMGSFVFSAPAQAQSAPANSWDYDTVLGGNVGKDTSVNGITDITVNGGNGFVEGNADIYAGHTVNVTGDNSATFAYRDNRANISSTLDGNLNSNMQVVIIDNDGVFFSGGSRVDVQSLLVTTGHIAVDDIMDGNAMISMGDIASKSIDLNGQIIVQDDAVFVARNVTNNGKITVVNNNGRVLFASADQVKLAKVGTTGTKIDTPIHGLVVNTGTIRMGDAGLLSMVGAYAENSGVINAKMGNVSIISGDIVTIDMYGDGLVEVAVQGEIEEAYAHNAGHINAAGGVVQITAQVAEGTLGYVVNNDGIIDVSSVTVDGGKVILSGGENGSVRNAGRVVTSEGGSITVAAKDFLQEKNIYSDPATTKTLAPIQSGSIPHPTVKPAHGVKVTYPVLTSNGGNIAINTSGNVTILDGAVSAAGGNIAIDNDGVFYSKSASTLKTTGEGTIALRQNKAPVTTTTPQLARVSLISAPVMPLGTIQNAIDAISNTGTGTNTVDVGAGTYVENVRMDENNLILTGANQGLHGRAPTRGAETIIQAAFPSPGVYITGDNSVVDGFQINGGVAGVRVNSADNITIAHNRIIGQEHPAGEGNSYAGFATGDGVFVQNSTGTTVSKNHIEQMNDDGIHAVDVVDFTAYDNVINGSDGRGDEGIAISHARGTTVIDKNTITRARRDAIQLIDVQGENSVTNNIIFHAGRSGINLVDVDGTQVNGNTINFTGLGMDIVNSAYVSGSENEIRGVDDGILIQSSHHVEFTNNTITEADEGVVIRNATRIELHDNTISAETNGIRFKDGVTNTHRSNVFGNTIDAGVNGILVDGDVTQGSIINLGSRANGNTIVAGVDGVNVTGTITGSRVRVTGSDITAGEDGVQFYGIGDDGVGAVWFNDSIVAQSGDAVSVGFVNSGIDGGLTVSGNKLLSGTDAGVQIGSVTNSTVSIVENDLIQGDIDGVRFESGVTDSFVLIGEQDLDEPSVIKGIEGNGIAFKGLIANSDILIGSNGKAVTQSAQATSAYETFTQAGAVISGGLDGVSFTGGSVGSAISLLDNTIENSGRNGILADGVNAISIANNDIRNNAGHGLYIRGANNGSVILQGNQFTDNGQLEQQAAARFESGEIDVSNLDNPNIFTNTTDNPATAMQFDAFQSPLNIDTGSDQTDPQLDGEFQDSPDADIGSVQSAPLTIVGETLGATIFDGYTPNESFYVRFENGSILNPVTNAPIVIDATNASFDGVVPAAFAGNVLPVAELNFIENRLFDADDVIVNGRGQIFVGTAPVITPLAPADLDNIEDFLPNGAREVRPPATAASVFIPALPAVNVAGLSRLTNPAGNLNNIAPAAGEGDARPQSQVFANIEPEAGSQGNVQGVTCANDALASVGSGAVNYTFGGSLEDALQGQTSCSAVTGI